MTILSLAKVAHSLLQGTYHILFDEDALLSALLLGAVGHLYASGIKSGEMESFWVSLMVYRVGCSGAVKLSLKTMKMPKC